MFCTFSAEDFVAVHCYPPFPNLFSSCCWLWNSCVHCCLRSLCFTARVHPGWYMRDQRCVLRGIRASPMHRHARGLCGCFFLLMRYGTQTCVCFLRRAYVRKADANVRSACSSRRRFLLFGAPLSAGNYSFSAFFFVFSCLLCFAVVAPARSHLCHSSLSSIVLLCTSPFFPHALFFGVHSLSSPHQLHFFFYLSTF